MKVRGKKATSCSFLDPPEKPSPCFFNYTPKKGKSLFQTVSKNKPVQLQLYQFNVFCTSSEKIVLKEKIVLQHIRNNIIVYVDVYVSVYVRSGVTT